jgi:hypothetical protein
MSGMQTVVSAIRQARASLALTVARAKVLLSSEKVLAQLGARSESESKISPGPSLRDARATRLAYSVREPTNPVVDLVLCYAVAARPH